MDKYKIHSTLTAEIFFIIDSMKLYFPYRLLHYFIYHRGHELCFSWNTDEHDKYAAFSPMIACVCMY